MSASRFAALSVLAVALFFHAAGPVEAQEREAERLWEDFNHYTLIARPDMAQGVGERLLDAVEPMELALLIEGSEYTDYIATLDRAERFANMAELAADMRRAIQDGKVEMARDADRIAADVQRLGEGRRAYRNAVERLQAAGQFAVPEMLEVLRDPDQAQLHPRVLDALREIGRPIVEPLSVALPHVQPATQAQIARVLGQVGYPHPLAYMRQLMEDEAADPGAQRAIERAYDELIGEASSARGLNAAETFLLLGRSQYRAGTLERRLPSYDADADKGIVWAFSNIAGLVPIEVPPAIHADVLAMESAERALGLNANLDAALSLHLMANLRRANRLAGETDPTYADDRQSPHFYATLAGPARLHDVLAQALRDHDAALALDAVTALGSTAGTASLIGGEAGGRQPLIESLAFPDRRVRFHAAKALANARPTEEFDAFYQVVPILADAVRETDSRYAVVLAESQGALNELMAAVGDMGFETIGGLNLSDVRGEIDERPGIDLIVSEQSADRVRSNMRQSSGDYKLAASPMIAIVSAGSQVTLSHEYESQARFRAISRGQGYSEVQSAIEQVEQDYAGLSVGAAESEEMALTALAVLRDLALAGGIYDVDEAIPAVVQALEDQREQVVRGAGELLALLDHERAQRALADVAITASGDVQIALLDNLAASARQFGNRLSSAQTDDLADLIDTTSGETANAAGRAHGALSLPTGRAVEKILE